MTKKRVTIYDIATELGITASYVSRALNNYPSVNKEMVEVVKRKAAELNYKHNSSAANLRQGHSKTIGVIVPHINQSFFSDAIAGIEEVCVEHGHSLIICQSHESLKQEILAIETLIRQNVDCIFISVSTETRTTEYLEEILKHNIGLIQFDRYLDNMNGYRVTNDNKQASYNAVTQLIKDGYRRIAFLGGPDHISIFRERREGYQEAVKSAALNMSPNYIVMDVLGKEPAYNTSRELLSATEPPDAFFTVSDHQSLGVLQAAVSLGISVPGQLGVIGFANEFFTELIAPTLSSIDQHSKALGRCTANLYFNTIVHNDGLQNFNDKITIETELIMRESSSKPAAIPTNEHDII